MNAGSIRDDASVTRFLLLSLSVLFETRKLECIRTVPRPIVTSRPIPGRGILHLLVVVWVLGLLLQGTGNSARFGMANSLA